MVGAYTWITVILNGLLWKRRDHSVIFETASKYYISDSFVDYEGFSISSKGFLSTVDIMFTWWIKLTHSSPFYPLIYKLSMITLATACLTTSNLPWFIMDLTFQVPRQYSLQHQTLLPSAVTSTTGFCFHFGSGSSFFLELFFHSILSISILGTYQPKEFTFQCHIFLPFHTVPEVLKARILKLFAISFFRLYFLGLQNHWR